MSVSQPAANAWGITDPNGNQCYFREGVERLPMRPKFMMARSAKRVARAWMATLMLAT